MSHEVEDIKPFTLSPEPADAFPNYIVEEEEEEETNITIDFDNKTMYSKEESWIIRDSETKEVLIQGGTIDANSTLASSIRSSLPPMDEVKQKAPEPVAVPGAEFKNDLQDIFLNSLTSKAVASLLKKHRDLDTELELKLEKAGYMGDLSNLIREGIDEVMDKRRNELRQAFNGSQVRFEHIPDWAKGYVRDYIRGAVHGLAVFTEE